MKTALAGSYETLVLTLYQKIILRHWDPTQIWLAHKFPLYSQILFVYVVESFKWNVLTTTQIDIYVD